jgi:hypothetical protein
MTEIASTQPTTKLNTMALVGFILSVSAFFVGITAIPGVVLGHIGLSQIKKTGEQGRGLGIAALAVGYAMIGFAVIGIIIAVIMVVVFGAVYGDAAVNMLENSGGAI